MKSASEVSADAADWLIRLEAPASTQDWDAFQGWMDADARHRAAFIRVRTGWIRCDRLKLVRPEDGRVDPDLLVGVTLGSSGLLPTRRTQATGQPPAATPGEQPIRLAPPESAAPPIWVKQPTARRGFLAAAAAVSIAVAAAGWWARARTDWKEYDTEVGGRQRIGLADGSTVELNTDSRLLVRLSGEQREIELVRGEALFSVTRDARRPFDVLAGSTVVRALGTAFSVRIHDDRRVEVLVAEGRVALAPRDSTFIHNYSSAPALSANETVMLAAEGPATASRGSNSAPLPIRRVPAADVSRKLAWTVGHIAFGGESLEHAVEEFNRYNLRRLELADPSLREIRVGGIFEATDPESFAAALARSFGIRGVHEGNVIRLTRGPGPELQ